MQVAAGTGAVVFTDIVGFTQFTEERGDEIALALLERQDELVRTALPGDARVVKEIGDGLLLWFADAPDAARTCLTLQRRFACESSEDAPLWVRMGLHWGTPTRRGEDLVGRDVNLAARIVDLAAPGEVLVSEAAARRLDGIDAVRLEELGPVFVRGVPDPVRLYRALDASAAGC